MPARCGQVEETKITHTLREHQGNVGFDFRGWTIRQYPTGKTHSGRAGGGANPLLGFKTIITPSKEAVRHHVAELQAVIKRNRNAKQGKLMKELNAVTRGWTNYHRRVVAAHTFHYCDQTLYLQLTAWAQHRHPNKGKRWISNKYWHLDEGEGWIFKDPEGARLRKHGQTPIQRHVKVKGTASPYDGKLLYWGQRLRSNYLLSGTKGKLLQKQGGKCGWCGLHFKEEDSIEIDHIIPKSLGGTEELQNKWALHLHCHDQRHARGANGTYDRGHLTEEPDEVKVSRPVLKTSSGGDSDA